MAVRKTVAKKINGRQPDDPLGAIISEYFTIKRERASYQRMVDEAKERMDALTARANDFMKEHKLTGGKCAAGSALRKPMSYPQLEDYDAFIKYVHDNEAYELLQRRLSLTACRERWDEKLSIPGVKRNAIFEVLFTAARSKAEEE